MHSLAHLLIICACAILCQLLESLEMSGQNSHALKSTLGMICIFHFSNFRERVLSTVEERGGLGVGVEFVQDDDNTNLGFDA